MELEILPRWDLSDLYSGPEAAELADDFNRVSAAAIKFKNDYCGKVASLSAAELSNFWISPALSILDGPAKG